MAKAEDFPGVHDKGSIWFQYSVFVSNMKITALPQDSTVISMYREDYACSIAPVGQVPAQVPQSMQALASI